MRQSSLNKFLYVAVMLCCIACHTQSQPSTWKIEDGYIPDAASATKVAGVILTNVYGAEVINEELPLKARLLNGKVWMVEGTFNRNGKGGVAYLKIQKSDGKVLEVIHGK